MVFYPVAMVVEWSGAVTADLHGQAGAGPLTAPGVQPGRRLDAVSRLVVDYLRSVSSLDLWAVTRVAQGSELFLTATAPTAGIPLLVGDSVPFSQTMCRQMISGAGPRVAPDVRAVQAFQAWVAFADAADIKIESFVGMPIVLPDGALFGTLCGFGSRVQSDSLSALEPLLVLLSALLSAVLEADMTATNAARERESALRESDVDVLTGLLNRRGWERFIESEEARFRRFGDPAAVIMMDLDRLKHINDTDGHAAGDECIRRAAQILLGVCRASDVVARLGGDEFGVIAVGADPEQAKVLLQRLDQRLTAAGVSGSLGYAPFSVVAGFPGAQQAADAMMYEQKRRRSNSQDATAAPRPAVSPPAQRRPTSAGR